MSWSISLIGTPEKVAIALQEQSEKLTGQSKIEYDSVLPSLVGIAKENFGNHATQLLKVEASGHGTATNGEQTQRQCIVNISSFYSQILV